MRDLYYKNNELFKSMLRKIDILEKIIVVLSFLFLVVLFIGIYFILKHHEYYAFS
jgi:hypothetical protein